MSKQTIRFGYVGIVALAAVLGAYWHSQGENAAPTGQHEAVAPVRVARVQRRDMPVVAHTLGTVVANATVQVTAQVQGTLDSADFREGQFVHAGDLLFQIDPRPFQAALDQARAVLQRDEALLTNARRDRARYQTLYQQHTISAQMNDTTSTNADVLAATVAADRASLELAQLNLDYTRIRAPIDGKTGPLLVHPGNLVTNTGNTPLVTIAQIQPIKLSFNLPQSDLVLVQSRLKSHSIIATIDARDSPDSLLSAPVDFTSNEINTQSGTFELRANFANADMSMLPAQTVNVTVTLNNIPDALVVPHNAIDDGPDGSYVYLVRDGRAVQRSVRILFDDSQNAAIEGNLKPGDPVIVEGQLRVVPGGNVRVFAAASESANSPKSASAEASTSHSQ